VVAADPLGRHQLGEAGAVEVVTGHPVLQVRVPVDLHRAGDVPGVVEQHVLVGLDDDHVGVVEVGGQPVGADQALGVGIRLELLGVVGRDRGHALSGATTGMEKS
jgi:hypothetical protein